MSKPLKFGIVAGEESGNLLAFDLVKSLETKLESSIEIVGVGGDELTQLGLKTLFNPDEIALMGLGAILAKLPKLIKRINQTAKYIAKEKPDCVILIDSPEFTHRVAKKIKKLDPTIPIIKYIAPSVWAWRPERAREMRNYIDHVLVVLPFEVKVMHDLHGPEATYVGHRLLTNENLIKTKTFRKQNKDVSQPTIVVLPGSRRSEIHSLMPAFGEAISILNKRIGNLRVILPTLSRLEKDINEETTRWDVKPEIVIGEEAKWSAFALADAALAASGTVSLELALTGIPMQLCYRADWFAKTFLLPKITVWSAALPNIIADTPIVPEYFNEFIRPGMLARQLENLMQKTLIQQAQMEGFSKIWSVMKTDKPSGELAADVVINMLHLK